MQSSAAGSVTTRSQRVGIVGGLGFDRVIVALSAWLIGGLYLDGWAHIHIPGMETFFTPWHGILYSGFFALGAGIMWSVWHNHRQGLPWPQAMPAGYGLSVIGAFTFVIGGAGDMAWHILWGIEENIEALLSPTHLILATGIVLMISGPLRAAWRRPRSSGSSAWAAMLPVVLAMTLLWSLVTFFTMYANPQATTWAARPFRPGIIVPRIAGKGLESVVSLEQGLGVSSFLIQAAILAGLFLPVLQRWQLPFGSLTLAITLNGTLMALIRDRGLATGPMPIIIASALAGIAADTIVWRIRSLLPPQLALRLIGFLLPTILFSLYFAALMLAGGGVWWSIHLWAGTVVLSGIVGFAGALLLTLPKTEAVTT
ncbi:MAG: hypothetical protein NVSMB42_01680 [Herpetosiphon sp.]